MKFVALSPALLVAYLLVGCSQETLQKPNLTDSTGGQPTNSHQLRPDLAPPVKSSVEVTTNSAPRSTTPSGSGQHATNPSQYLNLVEAQVRKASDILESITPSEQQAPNSTKEEFEELASMYDQASTDLGNLAAETRNMQHPAGSERLHSAVVDWINDLATYTESAASQSKSGSKPTAFRASESFRTELDLYRKANSL